MAQRRVILPPAILESIRAVGGSAALTPDVRNTAIRAMLVATATAQVGPVDLTAFAIPDEQWVAVCDALLSAHGDGAARDRLAGDFVAHGPGSYPPEGF